MEAGEKMDKEIVVVTGGGIGDRMEAGEMACSTCEQVAQDYILRDAAFALAVEVRAGCPRRRCSYCFEPVRCDRPEGYRCYGNSKCRESDEERERRVAWNILCSTRCEVCGEYKNVCCCETEAG